CCEIRCGCRRSEQPTVHTLAERDPDRVFSEHPDASWRAFPGARSSTPFHQKVDNGGCARRRPDREPGRPREAHREGVLSARFAATDGETATAWRRNAWGTSGGTVVPKKGQSQNTRPRGTSNPGSGPHEPASTLFTCRSCSTASWNCSHLPCPVPAPYWWTAPWDWEATPRHSSRPAPNCVCSGWIVTPRPWNAVPCACSPTPTAPTSCTRSTPTSRMPWTKPVPPRPTRSCSTSVCPHHSWTRPNAGSPTPTTPPWTCAWTAPRNSPRPRSSTPSPCPNSLGSCASTGRNTSLPEWPRPSNATVPADPSNPPGNWPTWSAKPSRPPRAVPVVT